MQQSQQQDGGLQSPSPLNSMRGQDTMSPSGGMSNNYGNTFQGPTPSSVLNAGNNNPLTLYLAAAQQAQGAQQQDQSSPQDLSPQFANMTLQGQQQQQSQLTPQEAFYSGDMNVNQRSSGGLQAPSHYGHHATHSVNITNGFGNGYGVTGTLSAAGQSSAARGQHSRTVSLPVFSQPQPQPQQSQFGGLGAGLSGLGNNYGLAISTDGALPGWEEEESSAT